jgi:hypothetical protein
MYVLAKLPTIGVITRWPVVGFYSTETSEASLYGAGFASYLKLSLLVSELLFSLRRVRKPVVDTGTGRAE